MKTTTHKLTVKLDQADQDKYQTIVQFMAKHGMPEHVVDGYIYRVGLDTCFAQALKEPIPGSAQ